MFSSTVASAHYQRIRLKNLGNEAKFGGNKNISRPTFEKGKMVSNNRRRLLKNTKRPV